MSDQAANTQTFSVVEQDMARKLTAAMQQGAEFSKGKAGEKLAAVKMSEGQWWQVMYLLARVSGEEWAIKQVEAAKGKASA
jgi:hypothetical protein